MAPRGALANLSFTVDSASEDEMARDDLNALPTPDSNTENKAPARKARGKAAKAPAAAKPVAKGKTTARRASGENVLGVKKQNAAVAKKPSAKGRKVLAERQNANKSDTEELEEFEGEEDTAVSEVAPPTKKGRQAKSKKVQEDDSLAEIPAPTKKTRKAADAAPPTKTTTVKTTTKSRATKRAIKTEPELEPMIPETQAEPEPEPMDIEESIEIDEIPETAPPPPPQRKARQAPKHVRTARQTSAAPRRAGSVSDAERDAALRRTIGETTNKLEKITMKYDNLREVALSAKESNFEKLISRSNQTVKDQDAIIKALKDQIVETLKINQAELLEFEQEVARLAKAHERLLEERDTLKDQLASLRNENKAMSTKLTAARSSAPPENKTVPGSAAKSRSADMVLLSAAEAAHNVKIRQEKINLYSDLTNLVVLGVKKGGDDEFIFDCLQTGRNGTLHFHLTICNIDDANEDAEFIYTPLLDEQRDKELLDLLPPYLTEEIAFPRDHVGKFYSKVLESMSKKIELVE